jgi:NTP pyrophosphatase (non-canonical NTP hydrolase)
MTELDDLIPDSMTFDEYDEQALDTSIYEGRLIYPLFGLVSEAGECADKVKKWMRDENLDITVDISTQLTPEQKKALAYELGDVLWYLTNVAADLDYSLEEVATLNLDKLTSRKVRDKLHGSGDYR